MTGEITQDEIILDYSSRLKRMVADEHEWRAKTTLNLLAAENFASEQTRSFLSSDLSNRYTARDKLYRGTRYADQVEDLAVELAKKLFRAKYADVRSLSGHTCSLIVFMSLLNPGDKVVTCPPEYGGYPGSSDQGLGALLHLKNLYFPYDPNAMNIVSSEARSLISRENPELVIFGSSFIPFPYDIISSIPDEFPGVMAYDGSHVLGLIAGGEFQSPLDEGCSILMGSTHKSFFGPQGGLILSNDDEVFSIIDSKILPGIVDNIHLNRVASLAYTMIELLKFGRDYARQVVRNSQALAKTLDELGVPVKCKSAGYSKSHQVLLAYGEKETAGIANILEECDIIVDVGIRLGTSEVTRRGMKEGEMEKIAGLISEVLVKKLPTDVAKKGAHKLVNEFDLNNLAYTLDS